MNQTKKNALIEIRDFLASEALYKIRPGFDPWKSGGLPDYLDFEEINLDELIQKLDEVIND